MQLKAIISSLDLSDDTLVIKSSLGRNKWVQCYRINVLAFKKLLNANGVKYTDSELDETMRRLLFTKCRYRLPMKDSNNSKTMAVYTISCSDFEDQFLRQSN